MTKLRKDLKVYIIGMRGWVEVRVGKVPPKPHTTTCSKIVQISRRNYPRYTLGVGYVQPAEEFSTVEQTVILKATTWSGGRSICSMPSRRFFSMTRLSIRPDACIELPARHVKRVTKMDPQPPEVR